jgi:hypothetical protein
MTSLTNENIIFNTDEWPLVALLVLKMLVYFLVT